MEKTPSRQLTCVVHERRGRFPWGVRFELGPRTRAIHDGNIGFDEVATRFIDIPYS